jgi:hypothetical protein
MRAPASALLALVALLLLPALASADPSDVYVDYASDGKLDCGHSRTDLEGLLTDASINEYGDPLLLTKLKIAVRRQLAVGCGQGGGGSTPEPPATQPSQQPAEQPEEASEPETTAAPPTEAAGAEETTVATAEPETAAAESATEPATTVAEPAPETASRTEDVTVAAGPTEGDDGDSGGGLALLGVLGVAGIAVLAAGGWLARRSLTRG